MNAAKTKPNAKRNERRAVVSAQQTIPYVAMHPDGICQLPGGLYTKTVEYEDINYAVASTEDQTAIFGGWSSFLNYFDSSLPFQLSFVNRRSRSANRYKVNIPEQEDEFNSIRHEYVEMLKGQIAKSNNGIERTKYITFGLPAGSVAEARPRLGRVEADVMGNLKRLGVQSQPLDGRDRLAVLHAPTRQQLENDVFTVGGIAQKYNCALKRLDWQQEQGFVSSLVLGYNGIEIQRGMTTSSTAIFIPFMTRELRMGGQALYYGMNALSHNVIMADRKKLKSANGMYLGSTGSGKSFAAKRELINVFLATNDRIIVVDPMGEYAPLVQRLGGQVIDIAPDSPHHISPMDLQMNANDDESPLSMKADFLLSLCELIVGGREGLQPIEKTVIDRCVRLVYREMALGLETAKTPLLQDLYEELLKQPEPEARRVATALELYCTGSLNLFNHPTNVNLNSRVVCIVLKGLGENLRKIAMHTTNEFVTAAVNANHKAGIATWCYFDEFHILLRDELTASYFVVVWKMLRKKGCVPSALTQNVKDLLASPAISNILDNTDFLILLSQAQSDRAILAKQLGISEHQLSYITHSNSGEGLLFYGNVTIPFVDRFPKGEIYNLLTTRPEDMAHERKDE